MLDVSWPSMQVVVMNDDKGVNFPAGTAIAYTHPPLNVGREGPGGLTALLHFMKRRAIQVF